MRGSTSVLDRRLILVNYLKLVLAPSENFLEMQILDLTPDLFCQNLHLNKAPPADFFVHYGLISTTVDYW